MASVPIILGLTGSIGMGKTWAAKAFRHFGVPVHDADVEVHKLLGPGGAAVANVAAAFPGVLKGNAIDRVKLGDKVFGDADERRRLEAILHPHVLTAQRRFLQTHARRRSALVVLDIPLLFETNALHRVDAIAVVSAPAQVQRKRVLRRPGMTAAKLDAILAAQVPDELKRVLADFLVFTGASKGQSLRRIGQVAKLTKSIVAHAWGPAWPN